MAVTAEVMFFATIMVLESLCTTTPLIHTKAIAAFSENDIHTAKSVDNVDKTVDNQ